jgi:hypothetical protein
MKFVVADPKQVKTKEVNWFHKFNDIKKNMKDMPSVLDGSTSLRQAEKWLECVCKTHPGRIVDTCIAQASGLGSKDIRGLMAHDIGEYYPALSANEIYESKKLNSFPINFSIGKNEDKFILNAAKEYIQERNGLIRNTDKEIQMLNNTNGTWLRSRPSMYAENPNSPENNAIIDIHINRGENTTRSDEIRLHYHNLVAQAAGVPAQTLYQVNIQIDKAFKDQLIAMANISPSTEVAAKTIIKEAINNNSTSVAVSMNHVAMSQDVFTEIAQVGQKHWLSILGGESVSMEAEKKTLPKELNDEYTEISKKILVSTQMQKSAETSSASARAAMSEFADVNGINKNFKAPYDGTTIRENKKLNLQSLFEELTTNHGVNPNDLKKKKINSEMMFEMLEVDQNGNETIQAIDANKAIYFDGLDKGNLELAAEKHGVSLEEHTKTQMQPYISGQTRGPIKDAIDKINAEVNLQSLHTLEQLTQAPQLSNPDLTQNLKNTGVSKVMMS